MDVKISREVLEAFFDCKFKGYLKWTGQQGVGSEDECVFADLRERVKLQTIVQESRMDSSNDDARDETLNYLLLKKGLTLILSPHL